jgi:uncharacterized protein YuzE
MEKNVMVYFDKEADFLEVLFEKTEGYFRETDNDAVMEKVTSEGRVIGFSIMNVSEMSNMKPLSMILPLAA